MLLIADEFSIPFRAPPPQPRSRETASPPNSAPRHVGALGARLCVMMTRSETPTWGVRCGKSRPKTVRDRLTFIARSIPSVSQ